MTLYTLGRNSDKTGEGVITQGYHYLGTPAPLALPGQCKDQALPLSLMPTDEKTHHKVDWYFCSATVTTEQKRRSRGRWTWYRESKENRDSCTKARRPSPGGPPARVTTKAEKRKYLHLSHTKATSITCSSPEGPVCIFQGRKADTQSTTSQCVRGSVMDLSERPSQPSAARDCGAFSR